MISWVGTANSSLPHYLKNILNAVKKREELFNLTSSAYVSIYEENLIEMAQMTADELQSSCTDWKREQDGDKYILLPKIRDPTPRVASDDQLLKLTEFVSFLEN